MLPAGLVRQFQRMLPVLQAEETMGRINAGMAAAGTMEERSRRQYIRAIDRAMKTTRRRRRLSTRQAALVMGIPVEERKREK